MMETPAPRRRPLAAMLSVLGGVLAIVGSVIPWATVKADIFDRQVTQNVNGTEGSDGMITLVLGVVLVIAGAGLFLVRAGGGRKAAAVIALLAGLVVAGVGVYDIIDIKTNALDELISQLGTDPDTLTDEQRARFEEAVQIAVAPGLYVVVAAGLIGLIGGVMGLRGEPPAGVPAAPPAPMAAGAPMDTGFAGTAPPADGGVPAPPSPPTPQPPPAPPAPPSVP